jgi:hypothetical protein
VFTNCRTYLRWIAVTLILCVPVEPTVLAQSSGPASKVLTVEEAVDFALKNYPAVRASLEGVNAAQAGLVWPARIISLGQTCCGRRIVGPMEILWLVSRAQATLFVPTSAVARTTEAVFVVRIRDGKVEWVNVQTGESDGELRAGTRVTARESAPNAQGSSK